MGRRIWSEAIWEISVKRLFTSHGSNGLTYGLEDPWGLTMGTTGMHESVSKGDHDHEIAQG